MAEFKKRERISKGKLYLMILTAVCFEAMQIMFVFVFGALGLIPFLGFAFSAVGFIFSSLFAMCGYLAFWIWFKMSGANFSDNLDEIVWFYGTMLLEATILSFLPFFTLGVIRTAYLVRKKDGEYNKKHAPKSVSLSARIPRHERNRDTASTELAEQT